ncbi:MAG TPA: hypothetical protein DCP28_32500, partial [Cytophagales bacterium]|nr:hypothetical protein [Cytophagales bacterium]
MKSLLIILGLTLIGQSALAQQTGSIEGKWRDNEKNAVVLIYKQDGKYYGKLVAADDPKKNAHIQQNTIIVLDAFEWEEDDEYCCGTLYQPEEDRRLDGSLELLDNNTLEVTGYWG